MAEVVFDHVTRIYPGNDKPSVDDLNLDIKDGEFLVLVGPSGCGKSTTLRMLAGLEEVNKGRILIGGKDVSSRVLEPLVTIYRKSCFMEFRKQLTGGRTYSSEYALNHIARCRSLSMLSEQEKKTLFALLDTDDTVAAARKIYLSPKTVYTYTNNIGQKLNLNSILQVRQFIHSEFE